MLENIILKRYLTRASLLKLNSRNFHSNLRAFRTNIRTSSNNPFLYITNFAKLDNQINKYVLNRNPEEISQDLIINSVRACQDLQLSIYDYDKFWKNPINIKVNEKITEILSSEKVNFDKELLTKLFLLKLPVLTNIKIIETFYKRNPKDYIDKSIALVPFRHSLFNGDLKNALELTDLTTGHPNYISHKSDQLKSGVLKLAGTAIGITIFSKFGVQQIIEFGYLSENWRHLSSINAMVLTYLLNSSFFVTIVRFGRQLISSGGDFLTWQKGTFYTHWFKYADEMAFCAKIMEADLALNGGGASGGESSPELIEELCREDDAVSEGHTLQPGNTRDGKKVRLLERKDNLEELKMQAYWMSGGDGFEWVEPDQDPADLIWKQHLSQFDKPMINDTNTKNLKWAEELIEEKQ